MNDRKIIDWNPRIRHRRRIHKALILMALFLVTTLQILALPGGAQAQVFNSVGVPMTGPNDRCGEQIWTLEFSVSGPDVRGTFLGIHNPASMNVPTPLGPADCSNPTPDPNRLLVSHYDAAYSTAAAIGSLPVPQRGRPWPVPLALLFNIPLRNIPVPAGDLISAPIPLPGLRPPDPLPPTISRPSLPITLESWLSATGSMTSECFPNANLNSRTIFLTMGNLIPHGVYTVWGIWTDGGGLPQETPLAELPNTFVADRHGNAQWERDTDFCLDVTTPNGHRLQYISIAYHADAVTYGTVPADSLIPKTFIGVKGAPPFQSTAPPGAVTFPQLGFRVRATGGPDPAPPTSPGPTADTTAPVFTITPLAVTLEATSPGGAPAAYSIPAATGNSSTAVFDIVVQDTTPPLMAAPSDITITATDANGAVVSYTTPAANDLVDGLTPVRCTPASGGTFPIGVTPVECTSTDTRLNATTVHFDITVQAITPMSIKADAVAALVVLRDAETDPCFLEDYNKAIEDVNNSLSPGYWNGNQPSSVQEFDIAGNLLGLMGENVFRFERHACRLIEKELKGNVAGPVAAELSIVQEILYAVDKDLAQTALDVSTASIADPDHLAKSTASIADGNTAAVASDCGAIKFYQEGWTQAIGAR